MPRPSESNSTDPGVKVHAVTLDWVCRRAGYSQAELAKRVSLRLKRRATERKSETLPRSVSEVAIHHWRKGNRATCRLSVLTALADELGVAPDYLMVDRKSKHVHFTPRFGTPAKGRTKRVTAIPQLDMSVLATAWFHLPGWRNLFLADYAAGRVEQPPIKESELVNFIDHMHAALKIVLSPLSEGARAREDGGELLTELMRKEGRIDPAGWPVRYLWSGEDYGPGRQGT